MGCTPGAPHCRNSLRTGNLTGKSKKSAASAIPGHPARRDHGAGMALRGTCARGRANVHHRILHVCILECCFAKRRPEPRSPIAARYNSPIPIESQPIFDSRPRTGHGSPCCEPPRSSGRTIRFRAGSLGAWFSRRSSIGTIGRCFLPMSNNVHKSAATNLFTDDDRLA